MLACGLGPHHPRGINAGFTVFANDNFLQRYPSILGLSTVEYKLNVLHALQLHTLQCADIGVICTCCVSLSLICVRDIGYLGIARSIFADIYIKVVNVLVEIELDFIQGHWSLQSKYDARLPRITGLCLRIPEGRQVLVISFIARPRKFFLSVPIPATDHLSRGDPGMSAEGLLAHHPGSIDAHRTVFMQNDFVQNDPVAAVISACKHQLYILYILKRQSIQRTDISTVLILCICFCFVGKGNGRNLLIITTVAYINIKIMLVLTKVELHLSDLLRIGQSINDTGISLEANLCARIPAAINVAVKGFFRSQVRNICLILIPVADQGIVSQIQRGNSIRIIELRHFLRTIAQSFADALYSIQANPVAVILMIASREQDLNKSNILSV